MVTANAGSPATCDVFTVSAAVLALYLSVVGRLVGMAASRR
jgi:hypothetical protein